MPLKPKKVKELKYYEIIVRLMLPIILLVMVIMSISIKSEEYYAPRSKGSSFSNGWIDAISGEKIEKGEIEIKAGENILIKAKLPYNLNELSCLGFYDKGFFIVAYIDGFEIYHSGDSFDKEIGKEQSIAWRYITLSSDYSNKYITLAIQNDYTSTLKFDVSSIVYGSVSDITNIVIKDNYLDISIFIICTVIAVLLYGFSYVLKQSNYIQFYRRIKHLAVVTADVGLFVLTYDCSFQLFFKNPSVRYSLAYTSFILMPMLLVLYVETILEDSKIFNLILHSYIYVMSFAVLLYIFNIIHITDTIFISVIFVLVEFLLIAHTCCGVYLRNKTKDNLIQMIIALSTTLYIVPCMVIYYTTFSEYIAVIIGIGFVVYIFVMLFTQVRGIRLKYNSDKIEEQFKAIARIDGVTNGNSRIVAVEKLNENEFFLYGNPWFVHMDLLDFSSVNVSMGWESGNTILKEIYNECSNQIRDDELICSIGDSDFIFLLSSERSIDDFCLRISETVKNYIISNWEKLYLKAKYSAIRIQKNESLDSILDHAIMAYNSPYSDFHKHSNCYYYNDKCADEIKRQFAIESKINSAIDNDEFVMYLQPKVNTSTGVVDGAEALVRWKSPTEGLIPPGMFIPVAEKSGQIGKIDMVMFKKVCEYLSYRRDNGLRPIKISVNVSKKDIARENFFSKYEKIIKETNVPLENLEFEFTESSAYEDIDSIARIIEKIHVLGSEASIDDFGTSYSNLGAINSLSFDIIKLDKLFFDNGFPDDEKNYTLIKGLIEMFHNLNMKIVCEGVETKEQADALKQLNADLIQGFYYSKPLPLDEFEAFAND